MVMLALQKDFGELKLPASGSKVNTGHQGSSVRTQIGHHSFLIPFTKVLLAEECGS